MLKSSLKNISPIGKHYTDLPLNATSNKPRSPQFASLIRCQHLTLVWPDDSQKPFKVNLLCEGDKKRTDVEHFIGQTFHTAHHAKIQQFLPFILGVFNPQGGVSSAVGFRFASQDHLFLENYTNCSIERVLSRQTERPILRENIAEVGNLASCHPGVARKLILFLLHYFYYLGIDWAVFTGTSMVRNVYHRLGLDAVMLMEADGERLTSECDQWGSYYSNKPCVMACDVKKQLLRVAADVQLLED